MSTFNAQDSRGVIVALQAVRQAGRQAGAVKIYVATVRRSAQKKDSVKHSLPEKLMVFRVPPPPFQC
jgi:hypothetical protein